MAIIRVFREGKELLQLSVERGREYIAGRSESCDLVLSDPSISRQHLKFFVDDGAWKVQVLSRFGNISHLGALHQTLDLENGIRFYAGDFEIRFEEIQEVSKAAPVIEKKPVEQKSKAPLTKENDVNFSADTDGNLTTELDEKTSVGIVTVQPFVRVYNSKTHKTTDIRLTGPKWRAGRAPESQIVLDEGSASRNHFEIRRAGERFELIDLGSSNGTKLNGELLDENTPIDLTSGDIITIGATTIEFQVRDAQYAQKLQEAGLVPLPPPASSPYGIVSTGPRLRVIGGRQKGFSPKPIHWVIGGIVALMIVLSLTGKKEDVVDVGSSGVQDGSDASGPADPMKKLSPQQRKFLEDTYNLADSLFKRGKYELALIELHKITEIVPSYKRSRELEAYCQQAIDITKERDEIDRQQHKEAEIRTQVQQIVEECRRRIGTSPTVAATERCLAPASEMDPENAQAKSLLERVRRDEQGRDERRAQNAAYQEGARQLTSMYNKAAQYDKAAKYVDAISAYTKVIQADLPDPKGLKAKAKTQLAAAKSNVDKTIAQSQELANDLYSKEKFRDALIQLQKALDLNPADAKAKGLYDKVYNDLKKRLKAIYGDSVLEESLGNIEAAKQKWNNILEMDLESGEYYQKAKRMLKKYGG